MGEHFRKEVPASDNVSSSLHSCLSSTKERTVCGLKIMLMGFFSLAVLSKKSLHSIIAGGKEGGEGGFGKRN